MRASLIKFSQKVVGEAGVRVFTTGFVLLLARRLGAEEFGRYSLALAYASLSFIFVDLGTNAILTRHMVRNPKNRVQIGEASHFLKVVAGLLSFSLLWIGTRAARLSMEMTYATMCLGVFYICQSLNDYFCSLLTGMEEMGWEAVLKSASRFMSVAFGLWPLLTGRPLTLIVTAMAAGSVLGYVISVFILRHRLGSFGFDADINFIKELLRTSLPLFASAAFWILYESQDILLLNYFGQSQVQIGYFSSAIKIIDVLRIYPVLLISVFFPALSKLHMDDLVAYHQKKRRVQFFLFGSVLLFSASLFVFAKTLIQLIYAGSYHPAIPLLRALSPALLLTGLNYAQTQFLIAQDREQKLFASAFLVCATNVALAAYFIPRVGSLGACYALLGSEIFSFAFLQYLSHEKTSHR